MAPNTRPQHPLPKQTRGAAKAEVAVKVRIVGTPSDTDLSKLTQSVVKAVGKQLNAAQTTAFAGAYSPVRDPKFAPPSPTRMRELAQTVQANEAEEKLRTEGPRTILNLRYRWKPLADFLQGVASRSEADPTTYLAISDAVATMYVGSRDKSGSSHEINKTALLDSGLSDEDIAEVHRVFDSTGFAPQGIPVRDWAIDDGSGTGWALVRDRTEREANRIARGLAARHQAAIRAQADELLLGLLYALAGVKRGSASAGIVVPRAGAAYGPPRTYAPRTGEINDEIPPFAGQLPTPPGAARSNTGFQRELEVARFTGGRLARSGRVREGGALEDLKVRFKRPNGQSGAVDVDVIGPKGELILVGGPGKGGDKLGLTIQRVADLKLAAAERGVDAVAYFTSGTPKDVLDGAVKHLGADNVRLFDAPEYREPPR